MSNQNLSLEVSNLLDQLKEKIFNSENYISDDFQDLCIMLEKRMSDMDMERKKRIIQEVRECIAEGSIYVNIYLYSFMLHITHEKQDLTSCYDLIRNSKMLNAYTKYFLYEQLKVLMFSFANLDTDVTRIAKWRLFDQICFEFRNEVTASLTYIPEQDRNEELVVIIVEQMLDSTHGPTKTALERSTVIIRDWKKKVLLINTAEAAPLRGKIDLYKIFKSNYDERWSQCNTLLWNDIEIPFFQCTQNMPDVDIIDMLLLQIRELSPRYVLTLGGNSILANMVNDMIPVLSIGLGVSELEPTQTMFQSLCRKMNNNDRKLLKAVGMAENHVIETKLTFDLKPSYGSFSRIEIGMPEGKFILVVAGTRLDLEISHQFLEMLDNLCLTGKFFVAFAGVFNTYQQKIENYSNLVLQSKFFGLQNDMLAFFQVCDLFVNPIRKGGGTMAVEAMLKGIPVVTTPYSDISVYVGEAFWVKDYEEMSLEIQHYYEDKKYYALRAEMAENIARNLTEDKSPVISLLMEYDNRLHKLTEWEIYLHGMKKNLCEDRISKFMFNQMKNLETILCMTQEKEREEDIETVLEQADKRNIRVQFFLYSFFIDITKNPVYLERLLYLLLETDELLADSLYFCYYQIKSWMFDNPRLNVEQNQFLNWKLLERVEEKFIEEHKICLQKISDQDVNKNMAVVISQQLLGLDNGPTSTVLDRCYILQHKMKKKVLLINAAEILTQRGKIPIWRNAIGNYDAQLLSKDVIEYKNCRIPYFQCDINMPEIDTYLALLDVIKELKPSIVVSVGGGSLFTGLVNKLIPALCIGLTQCEIETSLTDYQVVPENIDVEENGLLRRMNKGDFYAIEGRFTFSLREQKEHLCRSEVGIKESDFVIGVVGWRLDTEITVEFLEMLKDVKDKNTKAVVVGKWEDYTKLADGHTWFREYVLYLGYCEDVLARLELCDLYVNPMRKGGGTSCVEAMYKGVPVVSIDYGDVAGIAGREFTCKDYEEMKKIIGRYRTDKIFWKEQSERARVTADRWMNLGEEFERCIDVYRQRFSHYEK